MPKLCLVTKDDILGHALARPLIHKLGYELTLLPAIPETRSEVDSDLLLYEISMQCPLEEHVAILARNAQVIPVIVLQKYSNLAYTEALMKTGILDYLTIPCPTERLQTTIRNALALHHLRHSMENWLRAGAHQNHFPQPPQPSRHVTLTHEDGGFKRLKELEIEIILMTLEMHHGCLARTAKRLGIGRTTLYRKLKYASTIAKPLPHALGTLQENGHYL